MSDWSVLLKKQIGANPAMSNMALISARAHAPEGVAIEKTPVPTKKRLVVEMKIKATASAFTIVIISWLSATMSSQIDALSTLAKSYSGIASMVPALRYSAICVILFS